jgi:hypothetical protein
VAPAKATMLIAVSKVMWESDGLMVLVLEYGLVVSVVVIFTARFRPYQAGSVSSREPSWAVLQE